MKKGLNAKAMLSISMAIFGTLGLFTRNISVSPLMAVLVSVVLLGESMTFRQLLGGILILGFTLWNEKNS